MKAAFSLGTHRACLQPLSPPPAASPFSSPASAPLAALPLLPRRQGRQQRQPLLHEAALLPRSVLLLSASSCL